MDIVVSGRHCTISDEVRQHVTERIQGVERFRDRVQRVEIEFTVRPAKGTPHDDVIAEITLRSKGPVVRAVAEADDKLVAFEKAMEKLRSQLRRAADRRKRHRGLRGEKHLPDPAPYLPGEEPEVDQVPVHKVAGVDVIGDGPFVVKEKVFTSVPLTLPQALDEMELVGHDFFLYSDAETGQPSVVYRRRGYDYGVIHLDVAP